MKTDCLNLFDLHSHNEYKDLIFYLKVQSVIFLHLYNKQKEYCTKYTCQPVCSGKLGINPLKIYRNGNYLSVASILLQYLEYND